LAITAVLRRQRLPRSATAIKTGTRDDEPLVRHVEYLKELPDFYIFYCRHRRRAETVKEERA
jgi:hypothetical protein